MNALELKQMGTKDLLEVAEKHGLKSVSRLKKADIIFNILKSISGDKTEIYGGGILETLPDGFGFLRSPSSSYLAGPDDIYVSPSQIRRFGLKTGDSVSGNIRPPKDGERYFALLKIDQINFESPEKTKNKVAFENLTPLFPTERLNLERDISSEENITGRIIDMIAPIWKRAKRPYSCEPKKW